VVTSAQLQLDQQRDRRRLARTVQHHRPRLLLLDPLVRLHSQNENDASAISALLGYLRALQRHFELALILVHHMRKHPRYAQPDGQNLRGSGDLHAWCDDSLYLRPHRNQQLLLTFEHRSAPALDPMVLALVRSEAGDDTHLEIVAAHTELDEQGRTLETELLAALRHGPLGRAELRRRLCIRNQRLGQLLTQLLDAGRIVHTEQGWSVPVPHHSDRRERNGGPSPQAEPAQLSLRCVSPQRHDAAP
jgi:hypothetical protein